MQYEEFASNNMNDRCTLNNKTLLDVLGKAYDGALVGAMFIHEHGTLEGVIARFNKPYGDFIDFKSLSDNELLALYDAISYMFDKYCFNFDLCRRKESYGNWDSGVIDRRFIRTEDMMEKKFLMLIKVVASVAIRGLPFKEIGKDGIDIKRAIPNILRDMTLVTNTPIGVAVILGYMDYLDSMEGVDSYIKPLYNKLKTIVSDALRGDKQKIDGYTISIQDGLFDRSKEYKQVYELSKSILGDRFKVYYFEVLMDIMNLCFEKPIFMREIKAD